MQNKFSIDKIDIIVHKECSFVEMVWHSSTSSEIYKKACLKMLEILKQYPYYKFLYDQRQMGIISSIDTKWTYEEYYPSYMKIVGKHKKSAVILSSSVLGEFAVKSLVDGIEKMENIGIDGFVNQYFKEKASAVTWLVID